MDVTARQYAELHRAAYIAGLRGALVDWGSHTEFARAAGLARGYLQYLLQPTNVRNPSQESAAAIVRLLQLDRLQKLDLVEHMELAAERRVRQWQQAQQGASAGEFPLEHARAIWATAMYGADPAMAREAYDDLVAILEPALWPQARRVSSLDRVEACLILHDVLCTVDRPTRALYYAKLAQTMLGHLDNTTRRRAFERWDHLRVNAAYAAVVSFTNLRLPDAARTEIAGAERWRTSSPAWQTWQPHFERSQLANFGLKGRFGLYDAEAAVYRAHDAVREATESLRPQFALLIDKEYALALSRYGSPRSARNGYRYLLPQVERMQAMEQLGPLRQTVVHAAMAAVCQSAGRSDEALHHAIVTDDLATRAGLLHQQRRIRQAFPDLVASDGL